MGLLSSQKSIKMYKSLATILVVALLVIAVADAKKVKKDKRYKPGKQLKKSVRLALERYSKRQADPTSTLSCPTGDFACPDRCVDATWECDGEADCINNYDEIHCSAGCTGHNKFQCANGNCVTAVYKCDGDNDCGDASDEAGCPVQSCTPEQMSCANGQCIPIEWKCDGDDDCGDRGDEMHCSCTADQITCANGGCIPDAYKCDGEDDCADLSDERNCPDVHPDACADKMSFADCNHMNTTTFPACLEHAEAFKQCRKFCGLCTNVRK